MYLSIDFVEKTDQVGLETKQGQKDTKNWRNLAAKVYTLPKCDHATYDSIHCAQLDGWKTVNKGERKRFIWDRISVILCWLPTITSIFEEWRHCLGQSLFRWPIIVNNLFWELCSAPSFGAVATKNAWELLRACCIGSGVQTDATTPNNVGTCSASWEGYNP